MLVKIEKRFLTYRCSLEILRTLQIIILGVRLIFNFRSRESAIFYQIPPLHCQNWVTFFFVFIVQLRRGTKLGDFFIA